jgi:hypothetical protein
MYRVAESVRKPFPPLPTETCCASPGAKVDQYILYVEGSVVRTPPPPPPPPTFLNLKFIRGGFTSFNYFFIIISPLILYNIKHFSGLTPEAFEFLKIC